MGSSQLSSHAGEEILPAQGAGKVHLGAVGHAVTHGADVAGEPCVGVEHTFAHVHRGQIAMVWGLQLG